MYKCEKCEKNIHAGFHCHLCDQSSIASDCSQGLRSASMPTSDRKPTSRKAIDVACDCARRGETEAAGTIRDLIALAKAYQNINVAYRVGKHPTGKSLDDSAALGWLIE